MAIMPLVQTGLQGKSPSLQPPSEIIALGKACGSYYSNELEAAFPQSVTKIAFGSSKPQMSSVGTDFLQLRDYSTLIYESLQRIVCLKRGSRPCTSN